MVDRARMRRPGPSAKVDNLMNYEPVLDFARPDRRFAPAGSIGGRFAVWPAGVFIRRMPPFFKS
ncbi:hypothetical protein DYH55_02055 [Methylovirgula sp. 4M-Z18]|nr:hypothetical protein DYH55_02055 [Methylovirgula sp. 4M-Z18]